MDIITDHLRQAQLSTKAVVDYLKHHATYAYSHYNDNESFAIKDSLELISVSHPPAEGTAKSAYLSAGVIQIPFFCQNDIAQLIGEANQNRAIFGESYRLLAKEKPNRSGKALIKLVQDLPGRIPFIQKGMHISVKQINRKLILLTSPEKISLYKEEQKRIETVTKESLLSEIECMSDERQAYYWDRLRNINFKDLRFCYSNNNFRYRANVLNRSMFETRWSNFALSSPMVVLEDNTIDLKKVSESNSRNTPRTDKRKLESFLPEIHLYVRS